LNVFIIDTSIIFNMIVITVGAYLSYTIRYVKKDFQEVNIKLIFK